MVARALASRGALRALVTDTWMPPAASTHLARLPLLRKLRERFHPALAGSPVYRDNGAFIRFELLHRLRKTADWTRVMARNRLFGRLAVRRLQQLRTTTPGTVFAYSYAGLEVLRWGREQGWRTVLGQIDPGPVEVEIVREEARREGRFREPWTEPPPEYWEHWRQECALADDIVVNSPWSHDALRQVGVPAEKLRVVPLAYETPEALPPPKRYPARFTPERPLRVLFLGQINLRKGVARLLQAAEALRQEAVEFWLVGTPQIGAASSVVAGAKLRWIGPVPRGEAAGYYRTADVFILPTLSDGFALTQLEASAHRLPIIVSAQCGRVVRDGVNGRVLPAPTTDAIVTAIRECLANPARLTAWSEASGIGPEFTSAALAGNLVNL